MHTSDLWGEGGKAPVGEKWAGILSRRAHRLDRATPHRRSVAEFVLFNALHEQNIEQSSPSARRTAPAQPGGPRVSVRFAMQKPGLILSLEPHRPAREGGKEKRGCPARRHPLFYKGNPVLVRWRSTGRSCSRIACPADGPYGPLRNGNSDCAYSVLYGRYALSRLLRSRCRIRRVAG